MIELAAVAMVVELGSIDTKRKKGRLDAVY